MDFYFKIREVDWLVWSEPVHLSSYWNFDSGVGPVLPPSLCGDISRRDKLVLTGRKGLPNYLWSGRFSEMVTILIVGSRTTKKRKNWTILRYLVPNQDRSDTSYT